jgi:hypothetical protein
MIFELAGLTAMDVMVSETKLLETTVQTLAADLWYAPPEMAPAYKTPGVPGS